MGELEGWVNDVERREKRGKVCEKGEVRKRLRGEGGEKSKVMGSWGKRMWKGEGQVNECGGKRVGEEGMVKRGS